MGGASNRSDDKGGGTTYSSQLKKIQKPNPIVKFVKGGGTVGAGIRVIKAVGGAISKKTKEINLARRKKFISKSGLTSDDINMNEKYLSSKEGLTELKAQGYTTVSDNSNTGGGAADNNPILSTNTEATKQVASSGIVTNNGIVAPTTAEVSQATSTMMSDANILVANKKKGRSTTILNKATGLGDTNLNTTKKTLGA